MLIHTRASVSVDTPSQPHYSATGGTKDASIKDFPQLHMERIGSNTRLQQNVGITSDGDAVRKFNAAPQAAVSCSLHAANRREQILLRHRFKHALINHFWNHVCSPKDKRGGKNVCSVLK